jgi:hypothetical protein
MDQLTTTKRIELEIEVRKVAINVAHVYGFAGIEFFCQQFHGIAKAYAEALEEENTIVNQLSLTEV